MSNKYIFFLIFTVSVMIGCSSPSENKEQFLNLWHSYNATVSSWDSSYKLNRPDLNKKEALLRDIDNKLHSFIDKLNRNGEVEEVKKTENKSDKGNFSSIIKFKYDNSVWTIPDEGSWRISLPPPGMGLP